MTAPTFSVIIPAPTFDEARPALDGLNAVPLKSKPLEIIVTTGRQPSAQRNKAIARASGTHIVFLDSDCEINPGHLTRLHELIVNRAPDIVGGPVHLKPTPSFWQHVFHAVLSHPLIVGAASARYASKGKLRLTDERELILCNLAVKKELFEKNGLFSEQLFPNEENEWMDRLDRSTKIYHDPTLVVLRPQRTTIRQFLYMLFQYGRGRTEQARVSQKTSLKQAPPFLLLFAILGALLSTAIFQFEIAGLSVYVCLLILTAKRNCHTWKHKICTGFVGPLAITAYALGQIKGFCTRLPQPGLCNISLFDSQGNPLV
jgi:glycosyltransferase involved in cell wall biosynthesis